MQLFYWKNLSKSGFINEFIRKTQNKKLGELVVRLGVKFNDLNLLNQALTHTSYANEAKDHSLHNERLEFLGDAVLELASSTYLFKTFTQMPEGEMTKARASVVCETSLAKLAMNLNVGQYLLLGKGERLTGGEHRPSILADAFWVNYWSYLFRPRLADCLRYVLDKLNEEFIAVKYGYNLKDYKTILQEVVQAKGQHVEYKLLAETGPDHAKLLNLL